VSVPLRARRRALLDGVLAAGPALATGWAVHSGAASVPFAPTALADRVIRLTPGEVSTAAIERFGHAARPLLAAGLVVLFVALAALIAFFVRGQKWAAAVWGVVLVAGGLAAPVDRSVPGAFGAAGSVVYGLALRVVRRPRRPAPAFDRGRRRAIAAIAGITASVLVAEHPLGRAAAWLVGTPRCLRTAGLPRAELPSRPPFPRIVGLTPEITPVVEHYVVDIDINLPVIDGPSWRLGVGGLVDRPLEVGVLELQRDFPLVEEISVLTCISNAVGGPLVGNSRWEGVRLAELLRRVGPKPGATGLAVRCADGYSAGIPLAAARHPVALVAIAQDGEALTREHGFPCRLRLPALYGMLNPKWVTSIELIDHPYLGYWAQQGWSPTAVVRTSSRIDAPRTASAGEPTWIAGVAWAGIRGIARVEVSTDGERTWQNAVLHRPGVTVGVDAMGVPLDPAGPRRLPGLV
jgi:DMSO/TMAO reductase YedYZ molybdopterin-dependent catalytic subunit